MRVPSVAALAFLLVAGPALALTPAEVTETAKGVRPALEEICSRTQAQVEDPAFLRRMVSSYGFEPDGERFRYMGEDGELIVSGFGAGCTLTVTGEAAMVAEADRQLQAFAASRGLTAEASDQKVTGEEGRRITRERSAPGKGRLQWQVFDDFNGRDRPSRLEGVYSARTH